MTNVITEGVFLLWWNHAFEAQNWLPEFGDGFPLALSPAWDIFFWPLNVIVGIAFFLHAYALIRGGWHRRSLIVETAINVALFAAGVAILSSGGLVCVSIPNDEVVHAVQFTARAALLVILGFVAWDVWSALRQLRGMVLSTA